MRCPRCQVELEVSATSCTQCGLLARALPTTQSATSSAYHPRSLSPDELTASSAHNATKTNETTQTKANKIGISTYNYPSGGAAKNEHLKQSQNFDVYIGEHCGRLLICFHDLYVKYRSFLEDNINDECRSTIINAIEQEMSRICQQNSRNNTIHKTTQAIAVRQAAYLNAGARYLKPMMQREIANDVGVHMSTISRIVNSLIALTPQGLILIKTLFTEGLSTASGDEVSNHAVKMLIKDLIEQEPPDRPLTDEDLVDMLALRKIKVSRRTIAKYREQMHVLGSRGRARSKVLESLDTENVITPKINTPIGFGKSLQSSTTSPSHTELKIDLDSVTDAIKGEVSKDQSTNHFNEGLKQLAAGEYDSAANLFSCAMALDYDPTQCLYNFGLSHFNKANRHINLFALKTSPVSDLVKDSLVTAVSAFERVISRLPTHTEARFNLVLAYMLIDRTDAALREQKALEGHDSELAKRASTLIELVKRNSGKQ